MSEFAKMLEARAARERAIVETNSAALEASRQLVDAAMPAPDSVPQAVWQLVQETGAAATVRLNELITSPRFNRLKASDQIRLIALAQERAYGKAAPGIKHKVTTVVTMTDATAKALESHAARAALPEYAGKPAKTDG